MENMHPLDSLFREKLKDKGNVFQEAHWELLLKELEKDKRRSILYYWRHAAAVALIAVGAWYFLGTGFNSDVIVDANDTPAKYESINKESVASDLVLENSAKDKIGQEEISTANENGENATAIVAEEEAEKEQAPEIEKPKQVAKQTERPKQLANKVDVAKTEAPSKIASGKNALVEAFKRKESSKYALTE